MRAILHQQQVIALGSIHNWPRGNLIVCFQFGVLLAVWNNRAMRRAMPCINPKHGAVLFNDPAVRIKRGSTMRA